MNNCVIVGAGTYGEVYLAYLRESNFNVVAFLDRDDKLIGTNIDDVPVIGDESLLEKSEYKSKIDSVFCPIGNNNVRRKILSKAKEIGYNIPSFIHSSVILHDTVKIGTGVYILPGTVVMPHVIIKDYCMISMGVKLAHHSILDEGTFLSTGVNFGANIHACQDAYVGIGATIMTGVKKIGTSCLIGAGSVVIRDVEDNAVVVGNPAKFLKYK